MGAIARAIGREENAAVSSLVCTLNDAVNMPAGLQGRAAIIDRDLTTLTPRARATVAAADGAAGNLVRSSVAARFIL